MIAELTLSKLVNPEKFPSPSYIRLREDRWPGYWLHSAALVTEEGDILRGLD